MASDRNRLITERRHGAEILVNLAKAFSISHERVRQIVLRVEQQDAR